MAKDRITAVILAGDTFEWTVAAGASRGRLRPVSSGCLDMGPLDANADDAESADSALTLADRLKAEGVSLKGRVTIGVGSDHAILRVVNLPAADEEEISGMVELQIDKFSPFPIETLAISHEVLRRGEDGNLVLIAAVQESVVDEIEETLSTAGLLPGRVDATVMGWWQLISATGNVSEAGWETIVLLSSTSTELIVVSDGVPVSFRVISAASDLDGEQLVSELTNEIDYTLMTLERQHGNIGDCAVSIWHEGDRPSSLVAGLEDARSCEIGTFSLDELPPVTEGLACRSIGKDVACIDMTPAAWRSAEASIQFKKRLLGAVGAVLLVWFLCLGAFFGGLFIQNRQLGVLREREKEWGEAADQVKQMRDRVILIQRYTNQTYSALECLREVCVAKSSSVEFSAYSYRKAEGLKITGTAPLVKQVYDFKKKLDESGFFTETELLGPRWDSKKRKQVFDLEIRMAGGES